MAEETKFEQFIRLTQSASKEEILWMNNYLSGIVQKQTGVAAAVARSPVAKITIAYGTETGNSKKLAIDFATKAKKNGILTKLVSLDQYRLNDFVKEEYFLTVVSTHGDGEPPLAAKKFYDHIHNNGFTVPQLKYSVLALGDTSYPMFCKTGEEIDEQLQKLGASRILPLQKCDLDYEEDAENWFGKFLQSINIGQTAISTSVEQPVVAKKPGGKKIYKGKILSNINLNGRGSNKQTHHIEIAAEGLDYLPGDSLGIVPHNPTDVVERIIKLTGSDPDTIIDWKKETCSLQELLSTKVNIAYLQEKAIKQYGAVISQEIPPARLDLLDMLKLYPLDASQLLSVLGFLNPIPPRLYTISSSPSAHYGEVHITVVKDIYRVNNEIRFGLCSNFINDQPENTTVDFFIQPNKRFRLAPADKDIIMIGPGTGIAPFRSFIAEREATSAIGRSWLFFGDQHFTSDFLYQTEWQNWFSTGSLTKINLAFSRDQEEKVYVQHKMLEHAAELLEWITKGAYIYICGTKDPMGNDVENALIQIISEQSDSTVEEATEYLEQLREQGRYEKDVY